MSFTSVCMRLIAIVAFTCSVAVCSASASELHVVTDSSWKATTTTPSAGWTAGGFDDSSWAQAHLNGAPPVSGSDAVAIWDSGTWNGTNGATHVWFRKTFSLGFEPTAASFRYNVDDDCDIYINGKQFVSDHNEASDLDVLVQISNAIEDLNWGLGGVENVIAVYGHDSVGGTEHFSMDLVIVPEPATLGLLAAGGFALIRRRHS